METNSQELDSTEAEQELCETIMGHARRGAGRRWRILGTCDESRHQYVLSEVADRFQGRLSRRVETNHLLPRNLQETSERKSARRRDRFGTTVGDYQGIDEADPMQGLLTDELRGEACETASKRLRHPTRRPFCYTTTKTSQVAGRSQRPWRHHFPSEDLAYRGRLKIQECLASKGGYAACSTNYENSRNHRGLFRDSLPRCDTHGVEDQARTWQTASRPVT